MCDSDIGVIILGLKITMTNISRKIERRIGSHQKPGINKKELNGKSRTEKCNN